MSRRVAIVGGGVAGIAAAIRLADAGCVPILIESRKRLGGRATSFTDPRSGLLLDNCQHVLVGCCTNLIDLYDRLGVLDRIQWHRTLYWTKGHGIVDEMKANWLPAPLHLAASLRRMKIFSKEEKRAISRAMWRLIRMGSKGRWACATTRLPSFSLTAISPSRSSTASGMPWSSARVISTYTVLGAACAMQAFQEGSLANRWSYTMGLSVEPLVSLYDPAERVIQAAGGELHLGTSARAIAFDKSRATGVVTDDGLVEASAVVSAVPFDRLDKLVSDAMRAADTRLRSLQTFEVSPILGVHLHFDRQVMDLPHLVLIDRPTHWLFNKGDDAHERQHVHAVISAADEWMALDETEIVRRVVDDVHHVLPESRGIDPVEVRAVKEKRATFAALPGIDQHRPPAAPAYVGVGGGGIENLFLAGDWCDTGWPATMEGAARSGYAAAAAITGRGGVVDDVPPSWLARRLGLR